MKREDIKIHWPYNTHRFGIVYRDHHSEAQEKLLRRVNGNDIDEDMILVIVLKSNEHVFVPLRTLDDF